MVKKLLSVLLIATMVISMAACGKKADETGVQTAQTAESTEAADASKEELNREPFGKIVIGNTTEISGDFVPYWQNNASDFDIYKLTSNAYATVDMTSNTEYVVDKTVVKDYKTTENEDGSKTYTWTINEGLVWNDGSPITASDYVASVMLWSSSVIAEMGAENIYGYYFKGFSDFSAGKSKEFPGVNLISDDTFAVTIAAENLPFFYELALVSVVPTKLSFWTDDTVTIKDDGKGCYFSDNFTKADYEAKLNAARAAVPRITCGPYSLTSFDTATKTAVLDINPLYKGNYEGKKPSIETVIIKKVTEETSMDELSTGSVDLLVQMTTGDQINTGLDLVDSGNFAYTAYDRSGYGKLQFTCDFGPTQFVEVRQAIAHLLDRNDFAKSYTGGFGSVVNGPYGEALWMYQESADELAEKLNPYPYSLEEAKKLLEQGGWVYDEKGNPYKSGIRYKKLEDGKLMPLVIEWASSEQNPVSELLVVKLQENPDLAAAGIKINQTVMTFPELLNYLYRDGSEDAKYSVPTYGMFNLGTGFVPVYDMSYYYTTDPELVAQGYNNNFIFDKELEKLSKDMILVSPDDKELFRQKFVDFQVKWNELLPDLPLYSNVYHDFYSAKLKDYNPNDIWDMTYAMLYAYVEE